MGNFGIKVSQKGFDVKSCADYELLFSSKWATWKIAEVGTVVIADATQDVVISTHSFGFAPAYYVYVLSGGQSQTSEVAYYVGSSTTELKWLGATLSAPAGSHTLKYFIFRYDLATVFTAPLNFGTGTTPNIGGDYGLKASYPGKDISSTDGRDFVTHSSYRGLQIYRTRVYTSGGLLSASFMHYLGYDPLIFAYFKPTASNYYRLVQAGDQDVKAWSDDTWVYLASTAGGTTSCIVFNDPYNLTE